MATLKPLAGRSKKVESNVPFYALILFSFVNYIQPQEYFPFLKAYRPAFTIAIITTIVYLLDAIRKGRIIIKLDVETNLLLFFLSFVIISIPFSMWRGGSFALLKDTYIKVVILYLLIANIVISTAQLKKMWWFIMFFCIFHSFTAIKNYLTGNFELGTRIGGSLSAISANPNDLALTVALTIPFALYFFQTEQRKLGKILYAIYLFFTTVAIFVTFSRGVFLALVVLYWLFFIKIAKKNVVKAVYTIIFLLIIFLPTLPKGYTQRIYTIFNISEDETRSAEERKAMMFTSLEVISEHPLMGVGLGSGILAMNEKGFFWNEIHNVYLQIGVDLGIPAMIIFLILLARLIKKMHWVQKKSLKLAGGSDLALLAWSLKTGFISFAVAAFFFPVAYYFYFYYLMGYAVALKRIAINCFAQEEVQLNSK